MKRLFVAFICLFSLSLAHAQDDSPQYRLRVPSAEEYLSQLPDFTTFISGGQETQRLLARLIDAIEAEFLFRYGEDADFDLLSAAYDKLGIGVYGGSGGDYFPALDLNAWNARMIEAWLLEHPTELDGLQRFQFADYNITIEPRDFTGDGVHEWLLDVTKGRDRILYHNYLVAFRNGENYQILAVPITWSADGFSSSSEEGNSLREQSFEDINADGIPEWILSTGGSDRRPGYTFYFNYTYIFAWRGNSIERIFFLSQGLRVENVDADDALELLTDERHFDNWGCGYVATTIFDWEGEDYIELAPQLEWSDCTARRAEDAMWSGDFSTAATLYDEFITAYLGQYDNYVDCTYQGVDSCNHSDITLIVQYFLIRRILAYALMGQTTQAANLLEDLRSHLPQYPDGFTQNILDANTTDAEAICLTAYNYYADQRPMSGGGMSEEEMHTFIPGELIEDVLFGVDYFMGRRLDPARAGCDINALNGTPMPTLAPTSTPYFYPSPTPDTRPQQAIWIDTQDVYEAFRAGDFETVLTITQSPVIQDDFQAAELQYYRALALEALNRPDDALTAYIAIYSAAPDSAWGQLALLHLEPIE